MKTYINWISGTTMRLIRREPLTRKEALVYFVMLLSVSTAVQLIFGSEAL